MRAIATLRGIDWRTTLYAVAGCRVCLPLIGSHRPAADLIGGVPHGAWPGSPNPEIAASLGPEGETVKEDDAACFDEVSELTMMIGKASSLGSLLNQHTSDNDADSTQSAQDRHDGSADAQVSGAGRVDSDDGSSDSGSPASRIFLVGGGGKMSRNVTWSWT